jgi:primosomal protein N'
MTIADVAFDAPVAHSFSYRVPEGWALAPGQRAIAPLRGASRVGMVVALRDGADARLKPLVRLVDREPILSRAQLDLVHWIAEQSLSSVGSTCAALLPPPLAAGGPGPGHAPGRPPARAPERPELLVGAGREKRLLERIEATPGSALVIAADLETTARWAQRLPRSTASQGSTRACPTRSAAWRGAPCATVRRAWRPGRARRCWRRCRRPPRSC